MTLLNRQIKTNTPQQQDSQMVLVAQKETNYNGDILSTGATIQVSKNEAKRLMAQGKETFKVKLD